MSRAIGRSPIHELISLTYAPGVRGVWAVGMNSAMNINPGIQMRKLRDGSGVMYYQDTDPLVKVSSGCAGGHGEPHQPLTHDKLLVCFE